MRFGGVGGTYPDWLPWSAGLCAGTCWVCRTPAPAMGLPGGTGSPSESGSPCSLCGISIVMVIAWKPEGFGAFVIQGVSPMMKQSCRLKDRRGAYTSLKAYPRTVFRRRERTVSAWGSTLLSPPETTRWRKH